MLLSSSRHDLSVFEPLPVYFCPDKFGFRITDDPDFVFDSDFPVFVFDRMRKYENKNGMGVLPTVPDRFHP